MTLNVWLQLRNVISGANVHNGNQIAPGTNATFTADIFGLNTPVNGSTSPSNLTNLATFPNPDAAVYSNGSAGLGSINTTNSHYASGLAALSTTFTSNGTKGTATINSIADNQTFGAPLQIGFTTVYVNPAGNDNVASAFTSNACGGAGFQPCFATIGGALTGALANVAIGGTIHIQAGTYTESPNFNQNCTVSIDGNVQLNGSLTLTTDTINANSFTLSLTGDFTKNGGTFNANTGTLTFNGSGAQHINGSAASETFNNVVVNKSGGTLDTVGGSTTSITANDLTLTAGAFTAPATLTVNGNALLNGGTLTGGATLDLNGNLTMNTTSTLTAGTNITSAGNWTNNGGTFTPGANTVTFDGAGAQAINGSASGQTFNNFVVNKGNTLSTSGSTTSITTNNLTMTLGTFTAPATLDINGSTTLNGGTLTAGSAITEAGSWTKNGGAFTAGAGTVTFDGSGAQTIGGSSSTAFNTLTISNAGSTVNLATSNITEAADLSVTSGTLDLSTLTANRAAAGGGTLSLATGTTLKIGGGNGMPTNFTTYSLGTTSPFATVEYYGGSGQTIAAMNYGNLTSSGAGARTLASSGTIGIAGVFTPGSNAYTITGSTIDFNGSGSQTIPAFNYNNLTSSNVGPRTLASSLTIGIAGVFTPGTNAYTVTGSTINFNGSGSQTIPAFNYNNLTSSSSGGRTLASSGTIGITGTFTPGANAYTSTGSTVAYNGAAAQMAGGIPYNNLTINNTLGLNVTGVTLTGNASVGGVLTLTSSDLDTGAFTLTMPASATSGPATNATDVVGNVKRTGFIAGTNTLSFGNPFNTIKINSGAVPADINVNLVKSAPVGFSGAVQRTYTITPNGANGPATLRLHYLDTELNGNTPESSLNLRRFNGTVWQPVLAITSNTGDATNNWLENNNVTTFSPWTFSTFNPSASNSSISGHITDANGDPLGGVVVGLSNGRRTIARADGNYLFSEVPTGDFYTLTPMLANHSFTPHTRSFSLLGNMTDAAFAGSADGSQTANPLDTDMYFVRQQYLDFLGREPDEPGLQFWTNQISGCLDDQVCIHNRRIDVSAQFFIAQEFQLSGSFIYDLYQGSLGRRPMFTEYASDRPQVIGGSDLDTQKATFAGAFVQRPEFVAKYQSQTTAETFVDALLQTVQQSGVDLSSQRDGLIATYNNGTDMTNSRALVVRAMSDDTVFRQSQYNKAFVLMEYFDYLQRDIDQDGYNFWLDVLNQGAANNYRGMVCSFLTSTEYQRRFSSVVTHNNGQCAGQ